MRAGLIILGLALGLLWVVGLSAGAASWLVWLDFVAAVIALLAGLIPQSAASALKGAPFFVGIGLLVLWIIALASAVVPWMTWWTFAFGIAFLLLGIWGMAREAPSGMRRPSRI